MTTDMENVHEPGAELLSADDAIEDAVRLRALFRQHRQVDQSVPLTVPLSVLLEALDHLEPEALRLVARRAEERLAEAHNS